MRSDGGAVACSGLILGESLCLGLIGAVLGIVLAVIGLRALLLAPTAREFIDPNLPPAVLGLGLVLGLLLSILGGIYPAHTRRVARSE